MRRFLISLTFSKGSDKRFGQSWAYQKKDGGNATVSFWFAKIKILDKKVGPLGVPAGI